MPINILMPALSPTMTEGKLASWQKQEGDPVESGDVIAEIETDKAVMEVEAVDDGVLGRIVVPAGTDSVQVNAVIGVILEEGEDAKALEDLSVAGDPGGDTGAGEVPLPAEPPMPGPDPESAAAQAPFLPSTDRIIASPLARRMAAHRKLDLSGLRGTGPHGRIIKRDVEAVPEAAASAPAVTPAPPSSVEQISAPTAPVGPADDAALPPYEDMPTSSIRKVIAKRLSDSKQTIPHFYLTVDCVLDNLLALRRDLNARSDAYRLSVNDFVIRAVAIALRKVPDANAMWAGDSIRKFSRADISVAVSIPDGLITPVIRDADAKGLAEISNEMKALATRARNGKLMPEDYQGGTMSVSNLGMYGIKEFSAIINPPQGCILAVGAGEQRPVVRDGALAVATVMSCTLAVDHRVIDGALGAAYLAAFKPLIEDPVGMLL